MSGLGHAAAKEDLAFVFGVHHRPQRVGHAVTSNDIARNGSGALEVVGCAGCHLIHEDFFGDASPEQHGNGVRQRSEEHTSELQSLMRNSYAVFCLTKQIKKQKTSTD